jgi:hypothetical protein
MLMLQPCINDHAAQMLQVRAVYAATSLSENKAECATQETNSYIAWT